MHCLVLPRHFLLHFLFFWLIGVLPLQAALQPPPVDPPKQQQTSKHRARRWMPREKATQERAPWLHYAWLALAILVGLTALLASIVAPLWLVARLLLLGFLSLWVVFVIVPMLQYRPDLFPRIPLIAVALLLLLLLGGAVLLQAQWLFWVVGIGFSILIAACLLAFSKRPITPSQTPDLEH